MKLPSIKITVQLLLIFAGFSLNAQTNDKKVNIGEALMDNHWHLKFKDNVKTDAYNLSTVDPTTRSSVVSFYKNKYLPNLNVPIGWTGNANTCQAGNTSQAYLDATFDMINYYRGMVNLGQVTNDVSLNAASQQAALIMSVNNNLSHNPPSNWTCYTAAGAQAAGSSNLALGISGPKAIVAYMDDYGSYNAPVGHRRWILNPKAAKFGTGSVGETTRRANALWVFGTTTGRPVADIIAWPPEGYVPNSVVYNRWSFSLNNSPAANYSSATVSMTENGLPITVNIVSRTNNGYGDNTLVWEPAGINFPSGQADRTINVTVSGITNAS